MRHAEVVAEPRSPSAGASEPFRRVGAWPIRRPTARSRVDPDPAGGLPVPRPARRRGLRRQGEEPARPAVVVLPGHRRPAPAHGHHGHHRGAGRVDRGRDRGRGAPAGVLLDQGVRPAVQRQVPRRQVLPVAGRHPQRGVPAGDGRAGREAKGTRYFGPYSHAWAIRETVDLLLRVFPMRSCSNGVFKRSGQIGRPCLLGYIDKCSAPCVGRVTAEEHREIVDDFCDFMGGNTNAFVSASRRRCTPPPSAQDYERAARLRDDLGALNKALEKQAVVLGDGTDADVHRARRGPARGRGPDVLRARRPDPGPARLGGRPGRGRATPASWSATSCSSSTPARPATRSRGRSWCPPCPRTPRPRGAARRACGARVSIRVPQRGDKRALQETVAANAEQSLALHKTKRASDLTTRNRALEEIQRRARAARRRRCGSSATTSPTCRAPRWWRRWWSSRTGWPARASTAGS